MDQYHSLFNRLLKLPDETLVHPAHDYKGDTVSTIGEKRRASVLVDLRDKAERVRHGQIPGSIHAAYSGLLDHLAPGGVLQEITRATGKRLLFYCAFGERSAMAVQAAHDAGLLQACHIKSGLNAWKQALGPVVQ